MEWRAVTHHHDTADARLERLPYTTYSDVLAYCVPDIILILTAKNKQFGIDSATAY